ncbi:MAG TPA: type II secretion system protein [Vicinamibacterales bacterium]|nr:type II secretion system protein [Vicinamibacterales bacterium]
MAALLVAIAILSVMMLVALPTWRHQAQREKEAELIFRGEQYARAIGLYQRKLAGALPPSIDILVEQKFLRRKYKDPITGDDFEPVFANSEAGMQAMQQAGPRISGDSVRMQSSVGPDGQRTVTATFQGNVTATFPDGSRGSARGPGTMTFRSPMGGAQPQGSPSGLAGAAGGIVGVVSKSTAQSIRLYNGRDRHDQWIFMYMAASPQAGQGVAPVQPGQTVAPGQRPPGPPPPAGRGRGF